MKITSCEITEIDKRILEKAAETGTIACGSNEYCGQLDCDQCILGDRDDRRLYQSEAKYILSIAKVVG